MVAELGAIYAYPDPAARPSQPWVRANMITSVDGAVSVGGKSGGLSGAADRLVFSVLRSLADVILVGAGTARAERYGQIRASQVWTQLRAGRPVTPPIAVVTRRLDLDLDGRLLAEGDGLARTIVLTTQSAPPERRAAAARTADVIIAGDQDVTATAAIAALAALGQHQILAEGGPTLLGQLAAGNLLDEFCLTVSPGIEGGHSGRIIAAPGGSPDGSAGLTGLRLDSLLEDGGHLFCRYLRAEPPP